MSFGKTINQAVESSIKEYINKISSKYDLDREELLKEWNSTGSTQTQDKTDKVELTQTPSGSFNKTSDELSGLKKSDLQALCKQEGVKSSGTKTELISFLLNRGEDIKSVPKKSTPAKSVPVKKSTQGVLANLSGMNIAIRRNNFGNYEHPETSFVFDRKTKKVIGKQNDDGEIDDLTTEDINICNKFKFKFNTPQNLDRKTRLDDEEVDELDDEVIESDDEDIPLDEEELIEEDDYISDEEGVEDDDEEIYDDE